MSDPLPAKLNRCLWLVLALAVLARLAFNIEGCLADPTYWNPIVDCCEYDGLARTLVQGYDPWNGPLTRPPLYPYLLTAVYYVFGPSLIAVRLLQLIAGCGHLLADLAYRPAAVWSEDRSVGCFDRSAVRTADLLREPADPGGSDGSGVTGRGLGGAACQRGFG